MRENSEDTSESEYDYEKYRLTHGLTPLTPGGSAPLSQTTEEEDFRDFGDEDDEDSSPDEKQPVVRAPVSLLPALKGEPGSVSLHHFELLRVLGKGSFGKVHPVRHSDMMRLVANLLYSRSYWHPRRTRAGYMH